MKNILGHAAIASLQLIAIAGFATIVWPAAIAANRVENLIYGKQENPFKDWLK